MRQIARTGEGFVVKWDGHTHQPTACRKKGTGPAESHPVQPEIDRIIIIVEATQSPCYQPTPSGDTRNYWPIQ